jgi:Undecaprenyl-phosphate glucose phosphotransferase
VAIVGGGELAEGLIEGLANMSKDDVRIVGLFDDRSDERSPGIVAGHAKLGTVDDLVVHARDERVDQVIFALPVTAEERIMSMLSKLWILPIDIRLWAHAGRLRLAAGACAYVGEVPTLALLDRPLGDWDRLAKSAFDRIVGLLLLVACTPLMVVIAAAVKLTSPGPVLFQQVRFGFNNERILVYKFRSLRVDACDPTARNMVTKDDPRITPVGRFLRRSSLDELPQLINVAIHGTLSLVGPRPHAMHAMAAGNEYDRVVDGYFARHRVKPGVTGWAQVNGWRGETDTVEKIRRRVECDLHYIENWSLWFDVRILAGTPASMVLGKNAY